MRFSKLIINNVIRSHRTYLGYFLSSTFSVFVFFIFSILNFHPQLKSGLGGSNHLIAEFAQMAMVVSQLLIVFLSFIFLWYSFGVFAKSRQTDLSIYVMLGIRPRDLKRLLFGENMVIGAAAITSGTLIGLVFMKIILIFIQSLLNITSGLDFYFPTMGILTTVVIYFLLFLLVSFLLIIKIETANLTQLGKSGDMPDPLPKVRFIYVLLSFLLIGSGYGALVYFVFSLRGFFTLFFVVFATVIGTFLFFHQVSVFYYLRKRQSTRFWKKETFLLTTEGIHRAKENANLFALITCTAAVALVGVSVTATLGSYEATTRNNLPAAFVFSRPSSIHKNTATTTENLGQEILTKIKIAGHSASLEEFDTYAFSFRIPTVSSNFYGSIMRVSDYNRIAKRFKLETLPITENNLFVPAFDVESIVKNPTEQVIEVPKNEDDYSDPYELNLIDAPFSFRLINYEKTWLASDAFVDRFLNDAQPTDIYGRSYQVIDFPGWENFPDLNNQIIDELNDKVHLFEENMENLHQASEAGKITNEEYAEQWDIAYQDFFEFTSLYNNWKMKRQANGFILMIGLLLGGVFFLFTASILYFRLFGDLDKQGRYHQTLYQIGLTPKMRRKIIIRQLFTMYFLPLLLATLHSAVAFWGLVQLSGISLWHYYWFIIAIYFVLQLILFTLSCWRYLIHLNVRAENPQAF
ncbi:MAG: ABC transporter permease [Enterococcus sp.]|nr:ABC transporter permease [Enterococcus sp.]